MEEADLLKERLQAITDKRRIQEDIAKKRRLIEEEKLKLQYIKKKALREQWLMDGLSQQSEEEQEAMRIQAQDEQQQTDQLQSNILRIEKEIETLETQELNISANEEVVLKRLKEVEKTPEDIIKDLNSEFQTDSTLPAPEPIQDVPSSVPQIKSKPRPVCEADEPKRATFAIKICVERDKKTGKNQVISTAAISPGCLQEKGSKVYDDGRKSVFALQSESDEEPDGAVEELTPTEVEELLHQATDEKVQFHQPVYSVPYVRTSRASTPPTPCKTLPEEKTQLIQDMQEHLRLQRIQQYSASKSKLLCLSSSGQENEKNLNVWSDLSSRPEQGFTSKETGASRTGAPVPFNVRSVTRQPVPRPLDGPAPSSFSTGPSTRNLSISTENAASVNPVNTEPEAPEPESVTMIFMGYENAVDEDEDVQAELVVLDGSEDEDDADSCDENHSDREGCLWYHPEGCKSKILLPKVGMAKVSGGRAGTEDAYTKWEESELHKPTFIHKSGKSSVCRRRRRVEEPVNAGSISMMKMDLCAAVR